MKTSHYYVKTLQDFLEREVLSYFTDNKIKCEHFKCDKMCHKKEKTYTTSVKLVCLVLRSINNK